jgi:hypothetical protein
VEAPSSSVDASFEVDERLMLGKVDILASCRMIFLYVLSIKHFIESERETRMEDKNKTGEEMVVNGDRI